MAQASAGIKLQETEIQELREIFNLVDLDGGGTISKDELATLMLSLGLEASKADVTNIVNEIDSKGTGEIDFESFVQAMSRKAQLQHTMYRVKKFSRPNNPPGTVLVRDLTRALQEIGHPSTRMSTDEVAAVLRSIAPKLSADDYFDYDNFIDAVFSG